MIEKLTAAGYEATKRKLADLKDRLARMDERTDLNSAHREEARSSYHDMMRQYLREIKLYEAMHPEATE